MRLNIINPPCIVWYLSGPIHLILVLLQLLCWCWLPSVNSYSYAYASPLLPLSPSSLSLSTSFSSYSTVTIRCPPDRVLYPCKCHHNEQILCTESSTYSIGHIFKAIGKHHNTIMPSIRPLYKEFVLSNPYTTELNDNLFGTVRFEKITLFNMSSLQKIKSNAFRGTAEDVKMFTIKGNNQLTLSWVFQLFNALSSLVNAREMHLELNHYSYIPPYLFKTLNKDSSSSSDKITSKQIRLERLRIESSSLTQINGYAFYELNSLRYIRISSTAPGGLQRISAHAFDIAQPSNHLMIVDLRSNQLTIDNFEIDAFYAVNKPVHLQLANNNLTTVPQEIFERFLNVNQQNKINLKDNPLDCDCTMFWLMKDRSLYINQIMNAICEGYVNIWHLDETSFRRCDQDRDYMPRLIFRNSAIFHISFNHLILLPIVLQLVL